MPRAFAWFLAFRYLISRPVTWLGVLGVSLASWALIVVIAVFSGFIGSIRDGVRNSSPDLLVTDLPIDQSYQALAATLAEVDGVAALAPRLRHYGTFHQLATGDLVQVSSTVDFANRENDFLQLLGVDPELEPKVTPVREWLAPTAAAAGGGLFDVSATAAWHGRQRADLPVPKRVEDFRVDWPGMLLGKDRARRRWLQLGDPIELLTAAFAKDAEGKVRIYPVAWRCYFAGAFQTDHRTFDDNTALLPIETLRTMLGHDRESDDSIDVCTDIAVKVAAGFDYAAVAARLATATDALLPGGAHCSVLTWEQQNQVFLDAVEIERALMKLVLAAVMLIAAFLIYATLHMLVAQKVKDIGILGALGGAPRSVGAIFAVCGFVIGVLGCIGGVLLGVLNTIYLNPVLDFLGIRIFPPNMYDLKQVPTRLDPLWVMQVAGGAFVLAMLMAWLPARRAARLDPVEALSYE